MPRHRSTNASQKNALDERERAAPSDGECYFASDLHRWRGELRLARGSEALDEASFREAIAVAARQKVLFFELRTGTALGRLLQRQGRPKEGSALTRR